MNAVYTFLGHKSASTRVCNSLKIYFIRIANVFLATSSTVRYLYTSCVYVSVCVCKPHRYELFGKYICGSLCVPSCSQIHTLNVTLLACYSPFNVFTVNCNSIAPFRSKASPYTYIYISQPHV